MNSTVNEIPVTWLQAAGCTGCSVSLLNTVNPSIKNLLIDEVLPGARLGRSDGQGDPLRGLFALAHRAAVRGRQGRGGLRPLRDAHVPVVAAPSGPHDAEPVLLGRSDA